LIEGLTQFARTFVYTTAMPPALAAAACVAVHIAREEDWRREHLRTLIAHFRTRAMQFGLPLMDSATAIQPVVLGDAESTLAASRALEDKGFSSPRSARPPCRPARRACASRFRRRMKQARSIGCSTHWRNCRAARSPKITGSC